MTERRGAGAAGWYEFAGLPAGSYSVAFVPPAGYGFTQTGQGTPATDSDANAATGQSGTGDAAARPE